MTVFLPPPSQQVVDQGGYWIEIWYRAISDMVTGINAPTLPQYTLATLPDAGTVGQLIYLSDETGGAVMAFSDGTDWRRVTDRAIVS